MWTHSSRYSTGDASSVLSLRSDLTHVEVIAMSDGLSKGPTTLVSVGKSAADREESSRYTPGSVCSAGSVRKSAVTPISRYLAVARQKEYQ